MLTRPKDLSAVSGITWTAIVALLTVLLVQLPAWVSGLVLIGAIAGVVALSDEIRRAKANRVKKAMSICGYSLTTAARTADMDIADFSRMLTGARTLDDWRLEMLGDEFMRTLALLELQERGLPAFARAAVKIHSLLPSTKVSA